LCPFCGSFGKKKKGFGGGARSLCRQCGFCRASRCRRYFGPTGSTERMSCSNHRELGEGRIPCNKLCPSCSGKFHPQMLSLRDMPEWAMQKILWAKFIIAGARSRQVSRYSLLHNWLYSSFINELSDIQLPSFIIFSIHCKNVERRIISYEERKVSEQGEMRNVGTFCK